MRRIVQNIFIFSLNKQNKTKPKFLLLKTKVKFLNEKKNQSEMEDKKTAYFDAAFFLKKK